MGLFDRNRAAVASPLSAGGSGGGANTTLSNLASTQINAPLNAAQSSSGLELTTPAATGVTPSRNITLTTGSVVQGDGGAINLTTGESTDGSGGGASGGISLVTGDGDDISGGIQLRTGATAGTRGKLSFVDGSEGTIGHVWTQVDANGAGGWAPGSGSGDITSVAGGVGLTGGGPEGAVVLDLEDTDVTPGDYTAANISVDQQGRITLAGSGATSGTFPATFSGGVGEIAVPYSKVGHTISIEINLSTADPGAATISSGANDIPANLRPAQEQSFAVIVTDNGAETYGRMTVTTGGQITIGVGASGGVFTDDEAAGVLTTVTYTDL